jgi:hypothetical protein
MPSSPMGKTYLSTAVTEHGHPKQLVANTRIRKVKAIIKYGDLFHHHHRAEEAWIAFEGKRLTAWIAIP